jgi:hypothetical protein
LKIIYNSTTNTFNIFGKLLKEEIRKDTLKDIERVKNADGFELDEKYIECSTEDNNNSIL